MILLIDIGNSRLKWSLAEQERVAEVFAKDYRQAGYIAGLRRQWQDLPTPKQIAIASVSQPAVVAELAQLFQSLWPNSGFMYARTGLTAFGVKNAYPQAERLGVDRWLALLAARKHYPGPVCVVDCGTAITVDVMQADGTHLGGLICPGLQLMQHALAQNTADLRVSEQPYEPDLACDTQTAIANGVSLAAVGLIEQVMKKFATDYRLILTGGDAMSLAPLLSRPSAVDSALVLKGLLLYCRGESQ